ncbi:fibronectin type III domain-containing protein [Paenibacillus sp. UMB4589-SE434]|uniref:fibronectin type III domain-containing protein n=1 Tax=Paenibacillus sp. UMB4589-SE434 TaxID=3046314 RepID=UPI002551B700|nr:fibronectin type III domain-containing protein [Paenibacillus sp. UMB4589-SE434]MDK8180756.1 fibronectin type III domain-containing protein [Paenibacillus sp. UMB4589-SE434]
MKRLKLSFVLLFSVVLLLTVSPVFAATSQYTNGLLDRVPIYVGSAVDEGTTVSEMTDDNPANRAIVDTNKLAWYKFATPKVINSFVLKTNGETKIQFYDDKNNLVEVNPLPIDGVQTLPKAITVSIIVLKPTTSAYVHEWNVFETPSTPPSATTITWIQAGDKVVNLDWKSTGAKSYNVKRATSSGGPYTIIASNVTTTTYTDKTVDNGTTYYYVVSAANEAGESANSPEKGIKPEATQYTGGYLDGIKINLGAKVGSVLESVKEMTDNNPNSRVAIEGNKFAWHTFVDPVEITSVVAKTNGDTIMEFYDEKNESMLAYKPLLTDGIQTLPKTLNKVKTIVFKPASQYSSYIHEWNVFGTPSMAPAQTKINWIYGGDKVVKLEWVDTGAKSYNIKRSTSKGGPYSSLAASITGTSYTDKAVTNGTTYYYVVASVNEAGASAYSPERIIKPQATNYTGGLLDGLTLDAGDKFLYPTTPTKVRELTDNDTDTSLSISSRTAVVWYTFDSGKEISSFIVGSRASFKLELYNNKNELVYEQTTAVKEGVQLLPSPIGNVWTVVLKGENWASEWNVFGKNEHQPVPAPLNLTATAGDKSVVLNWSKVNNGTGYNVKRSTKAGGPYVTVATVTGSTYSYTDNTVTNGTTYYYVVSAVDAISESGNSNEASATPKGGDVVIPPITDDGQSGNRALLRLILNNGIEKEFDLSMKEVNAFITWYEGRAAGKGSVMFAIDKHNNNKGPFKNRKDYVFYDKIITFEVNGYDSADQPSVPEQKPNGNGSNGNNQPEPEELM